MKKNVIILFFLLVIFFPTIKVNAEISTVKCEYNLVSPNDIEHTLTKFSIYFNDKSGKILRLTHTNKKGIEVDFKHPEIDFPGYDHYHDYLLYDNWERRDYCYGNIIEMYKQQKKCADVYVYFNTKDTQYSISGTNADGYYSNYGYPISTNKSTGLYVSDDGENWKKPSSNTQNDTSTIKTVCKYNFGSVIGSATKDDHLNLDLTAERIVGIVIHKDVSINECGRKGYSYSWDDEKNYCYSKNSISYNLLFSSPDDANYKYDFLNVDFSNNPLLLNFGASYFSAMNNLSVVIKKETILKIFESGQCLDKTELYSYKNIDNYGGLDGWQFTITHDVQEAEDSEEEIFNGNSTINNGNISIENNEYNPEELDCDSLLGNPNIQGEPAFYLQIVFDVMKYVAIAIVLIFSALDFTGAVASQDNDAIKKSTKKLIIRLVLCVVIFVLPTILEFLFTLIDVYSPSTCRIN